MTGLPAVTAKLFLTPSTARLYQLYEAARNALACTTMAFKQKFQIKHICYQLCIKILRVNIISFNRLSDQNKVDLNLFYIQLNVVYIHILNKDILSFNSWGKTEVFSRTPPGNYIRQPRAGESNLVQSLGWVQCNIAPMEYMV